MHLLREQRAGFTGELRADASAALGLEPLIREIITDTPLAECAGLRIRIHGDLHLGQVLHTGDDIVFIDFEGDNTLPVRERIVKRSPLVDVASMLLSLRYAANSALVLNAGRLVEWRSRPDALERWLRVWLATTGGAYLQAYRGALGASPVVPAANDDFRRLLDVHLVGKAVYQIGYDLQNRPDWVPIALRTLREVVSETRRSV
jgi:maltose alpha-D-glucosyltransferase/alpha-amylase